MKNRSTIVYRVGKKAKDTSAMATPIDDRDNFHYSRKKAIAYWRDDVSKQFGFEYTILRIQTIELPIKED